MPLHCFEFWSLWIFLLNIAQTFSVKNAALRGKWSLAALYKVHLNVMNDFISLIILIDKQYIVQIKSNLSQFFLTSLFEWFEQFLKRF